MSERSQAGEADQEVRISHLFEVPRQAVFEAWTDPDQIARWWGPHGFDAPREKIEVELRIGGPFEIVMVVASAEIAAGMGVEVGAEFPDRSRIVELVEPELLVLAAPPQPELGLSVETKTRIEFAEEGNGTRVTLIGGPYTAAMAPNAEAGWTGSLEKLAKLLDRG